MRRPDPLIATPSQHPYASLEEAKSRIDPYSLLGLEMRGYQVMAGKTPAEDRVMIDGGYYRITAARENGLI
ncbi:hypothetical protein ACNRBS_22535 [Ralstonia pseudosolanacearum]|uniref:hypothetical protein n=1 Tax=Ralstonia pseudosolanacearum TaxID=1310165 RepID=UPI003AADCCE1